jgi:ABC-2 type transport system ATP-binding protein
MPESAILIESLEKYFPPALSGWRALLQPIARPTQRALGGVSFAVQRGEAVALAGPNGAGKSTLLRVLATLIVPTRGHAAVGGFDVERQPALARQQLGYHTGGDEGFYGRLTGRQNLSFFAAMNNLTGLVARERIAAVARWLGIGHELDRQVRTFSTGLMHRLGLARALLHGPAVLLLDEPTRSLDPLSAADFRRLLKQELVRDQGTTLLFSSHSLNEIEEIADRVILLDEGVIAACDSPRALCIATETPTLEKAMAKLIRHPVHAEVLP